MAHVKINLQSECEPTADVLTVPPSAYDAGGRFIALRLGDADVFLRGYDAAAVQSARQIIDALQLAIVQVEAAAEQAAV